MCVADGCSWQVRCWRVNTTNFFRVKKFINMHSCTSGISRVHQPLARRHWVASMIKVRLNDMPNMTPADVVNGIQHDHGVMLSYQQAWRGKDVAQEINDSSYVKAYEDLAKYLHKIRNTNPGTVTIIQTDVHDRFEHVYIGNGPYLYGFMYSCRPLMGLDETFLKGIYKGILLAAVGVDANENIFPIAYAVVESENASSWTWFLELLNEQFDERSDLPALTIISNRQKWLQAAIEKVFPTSEQGYCMNHLADNFKKAY
ncbi:uncharacterized protein LOC18428956 [Amborella trichopoda]|uniref:MULE transposase domain-containing protein n=1 Tax=Amborella trichopoda TaxID=13333 RepID=W1NZT3_AMBTC|nr:uncharacterized protein LOC18428956 [Amborella trichopoda]ERN00884.1 hypothetical protein AMTR_s00103p00134730 [Amborella trichopoda]|eukprot:XP_006838315.1 uncharacterized protein LOC18428956 [Amborella trichopoda]